MSVCACACVCVCVKQVSAALTCLDSIEAGYRSFATSMMDIVRTFPRAIAESNDK